MKIQEYPVAVPDYFINFRSHIRFATAGQVTVYGPVFIIDKYDIIYLRNVFECVADLFKIIVFKRYLNNIITSCLPFEFICSTRQLQFCPY